MPATEQLAAATNVRERSLGSGASYDELTMGTRW